MFPADMTNLDIIHGVCERCLKAGNEFERGVAATVQRQGWWSYKQCGIIMKGAFKFVPEPVKVEEPVKRKKVSRYDRH